MSTFKSSVNQNIGTSAITVYTGPAGGATVIGLSLANVYSLGTQVTVDVTLTKGATTVYLVKGAPVPVGSSLVVIGGDQKVVLESGNTLKVIASQASSIDSIISVLEM